MTFEYTPARRASAAKLAERNRKLSDAQAREIRAALAAGIRTQHEIALAYGVNDGTISRIGSRKHWKEVE